MRRWTAARIVTSALVLCGAGTAQAQSGIQLTPDGARTLVSKDVGGQRWAITRNPDHTVTGNVFSPGGGPPQFVWCRETSNQGGQLALSCSGADACPLAPCAADEWVFVADVSLPEAFFSPGSAASLARPSMQSPSAPTPMRRLSLERAAADGEPSGLQIDPEAVRTLISKDVGAERWAITRNEDGTVTGNVFFPGGGEPKFVWCEPLGEPDGSVALRCLGADPCARGEGSCSGAGWQLIADVTLPASFFAARQEVAIATVEAALTASLGEAATAAVAFALDAGYSLRQIARAGLSGRLRPSGEIVLRSGVVEPPAGPPDGALSGTAGAAATARVAGSPLVDRLRQKLAASGEEFGYGSLVVILLLAEQGYSISQIVEHMVLDGKVGIFDGNLYLTDDEEDIIPPAKVAQRVFGPTPPSPSPGATPTPTPRPTPTPTPATSCGDDVRQGSEQCDGPDLGGSSCASLGLGSGNLACTGTCAFDIRSCSSGGCPGGTFACENGCAPSGADCCEGQGGYCAPGSVCVGELLCCPSAAPKRCGNTCVAEGTSCCGNGSIDGAEQCDGADLGGQNCTSRGLPPGFLRCGPTCQFDTSGCACDAGFKLCGGTCIPLAAECCPGESRYCPAGSTCSEGGGCCGNGQVEGSEECDPPGIAGGCGGGDACSNDCTICFSPTSCEDRCCPGRDDSCTAPGVACFCDDYCVTAGDCCPDFGASCGG